MESEKVILFIKRAVILVLVFVMQVVLADKIRFLGVSPNFALAYILVISLKNYKSYSLVAAVISGILLDAVSGRIFGAYTFLFVLVCGLVKYIYLKMFSENFLFESLGGLFFNFIFSLIYGLGEWLFYGKFTSIFTQIVLFECLYNQIIFMVFLLISKKTRKKHRSIFRI